VGFVKRVGGVDAPDTVKPQPYSLGRATPTLRHLTSAAQI